MIRITFVCTVTAIGMTDTTPTSSPPTPPTAATAATAPTSEDERKGSTRAASDQITCAK